MTDHDDRHTTNSMLSIPDIPHFVVNNYEHNMWWVRLKNLPHIVSRAHIAPIAISPQDSWLTEKKSSYLMSEIFKIYSIRRNK